MMSSAANEPWISFDCMWETHRDFLRRLLIGLTRDIDRADDLLQDTYLKARSAVDGYRGGDARAWLAAIAKNAFYAHARRRYVRSETPIEDDVSDRDRTEDQVLAIALRKAIAELSPVLRGALVMRHYGGYSYSEIAERLGCPVGTAKRRVNAALKRLRTALTDEREERAAMKCTDITDRRLLDYVYGKLPVAEENTVREHLAGCSTCGGRAEEMGRVLRALDAVENDWKITAIVELSEEGIPTSYISMSMPNYFDEPTQEIELGSSSRSGLSFVSVWGEEAQFEIVPSEHEDEGRKFRVHLPRPASPGERFDLLMVVDDDRPMTGEGPVVPLGDGRWRFGPGGLHMTEALVYVVAVRLPGGARLTEATPVPSEVRSNDKTTVVWRNTLPSDQRFEFWIEYRLRQ